MAATHQDSRLRGASPPIGRCPRYRPVRHHDPGRGLGQRRRPWPGLRADRAARGYEDRPPAVVASRRRGPPSSATRMKFSTSGNAVRPKIARGWVNIHRMSLSGSDHRRVGKRSSKVPSSAKSRLLVNAPPGAVLETAGLKLTGSRLIIEIRRGLVVSGVSELSSSWFGTCGAGVWRGPSGVRALVEVRVRVAGQGEADAGPGAASRLSGLRVMGRVVARSGP